MSQTKPAGFAIAVTLSDTTNIDFEGTAHATRALFVGSGGDISVEMAGNNEKGGGLSDPTVVFLTVLSGSVLPISVTRVNVTLTTASSIVALW